jgi:hypothetical protein
MRRLPLLKGMGMRTLAWMLAGFVSLAAFGCSEINRDVSPVDMRATTQINQSIYDIASPPASSDIADILLSTIVKGNDSVLLDVKLQAYRVSFIRTDGGSAIPPPFTVSVNQLIPPNSTGEELDNFVPVDPLSLRNAPFAALLPQNGGRDPETGRSTVDMDVRVEVFGETLSGEDVYAVTRFPLTFCYGCLGG